MIINFDWLFGSYSITIILTLCSCRLGTTVNKVEEEGRGHHQATPTHLKITQRVCNPTT